MVAAVALGHALLGRWLGDALPQFGEGARLDGPARLQGRFTVDLLPSAPLPPPPVARPRRPAPAAAARTAHAASQAASDAAAADQRLARAAAAEPGASEASGASGASPMVEPMVEPPPAQALAPASAPDARTAQSLPASAALPASAGAAEARVAGAASDAASRAAAPTAVAGARAASAPDARSFDWPRSTRLSYALTGHYRGPVEGQASVEWLREGERYQVHVEVSIGPPFAPLVTRRLSSDGVIAPEGLRPRLFEELTTGVLRTPKRNTVRFDADEITLANGQRHARPPGVQDSASQFVQLTWLFGTQPERLRAGEQTRLLLALPRRLDPWVYDVLEPTVLHTPAGAIEAVHVRPRRPARPDGELAAEVWIAPSLQHLPVRIVIRQDEQNFVDLMVDRLPRQAQK